MAPAAPRGDAHAPTVTGLARRGRVWRLGAAVLLTHLWLATQVPAARLGAGAAERAPPRIDVAFVRELAPALPTVRPAPPSLAPPRKPRPQALPPVAAAAASATVATVPDEPVPIAQSEAATALPEPVAVAASQPAPDALGALAALAAAPAAAPVAAPVLAPLADDAVSANAATAPPQAVAAASAPPSAPGPGPAFDWPPSTRLSYILRGNYRGPVEGQAQVEWLRRGTRYQVHLDLAIGPRFAPLISRRLSSDGEITPEGLRPQRYDEETKVALRSPRHVTVHLDPEQVRLPGGAVLPRPPGVQDSASQFVQLAWMFSLQPGLLATGRKIELPLALPRQLSVWTYDVVGPETLSTPVGALPTVHLRPRREARPGGDLVAELWVAPTLQYLPVRILVRQGPEVWIDMQIERLPQQADATAMPVPVPVPAAVPVPLPMPMPMPMPISAPVPASAPVPDAAR